jgi:hypothetical protein
MARITLRVTFKLPPGALIDEAVLYTLDAVSTWKGSLQPPNAYGDGEPGDPMFNLDSDSVRVRYLCRTIPGKKKPAKRKGS